MAVKFGRLKMRARSEAFLNDFVAWIASIRQESDFSILSQDPRAYVRLDEFADDGTYILILDVFLKQEASVTAYANAISQYIAAVDTTDLVSAKVWKNNNCTHDEEFPQPDILTEVWAW